MTLEEFYEALRVFKKNTVWYNIDSAMRGRPIESYKLFCPLNCVNYYLNQTYLYTFQLFTLADNLNMYVQDCMDIMQASDGARLVKLGEKEIYIDLNPHQLEIRKKLQSILFDET